MKIIFILFTAGIIAMLTMPTALTWPIIIGMNLTLHTRFTIIAAVLLAEIISGVILNTLKSTISLVGLIFFTAAFIANSLYKALNIFVYDFYFNYISRPELPNLAVLPKGEYSCCVCLEDKDHIYFPSTSIKELVVKHENHAVCSSCFPSINQHGSVKNPLTNLVEATWHCFNNSRHDHSIIENRRFKAHPADQPTQAASFRQEPHIATHNLTSDAAPQTPPNAAPQTPPDAILGA
mgnify:FL=1|jgi:hypothetical protein